MSKALAVTSPKDLTKNLDKMSKKQLVEMVEQHVLPFSNPEKYKELVRAQIPEFAREIDNVEIKGTSIMETSQEMMLVIFDCLRRYHGLKDSDLKKLNIEITDVLTGVKEFEDAGLSMLSGHSVQIVGDNVQDLGIGGLLDKIARVRAQKAHTVKAGFDVAKQVDEAPFTKRIK